MEWYALHVPVHREEAMADRLRRRVQLERCAELFAQVVVPREVTREVRPGGRVRRVSRNPRPGMLYVQMSDCPLGWRVVGDALGDNLAAIGRVSPEEAAALALADKPAAADPSAPKVVIGFKLSGFTGRDSSK